MEDVVFGHMPAKSVSLNTSTKTTRFRRRALG
jgi:hypothetical protein